MSGGIFEGVGEVSEKNETNADAVSKLMIEFHQHDWIEGFAAFAAGASPPKPESRAFCVLNVGAFLAAVRTGEIEKSELPYLIAETMMHEVIHALEQWAGVEFSEERVDGLLERYAASHTKDHAA